MKTLHFNRMYNNISLEFGDLPEMRLYLDGKYICMFRIEDIWDAAIETLKNLPDRSSEDNSGLQRRHDEAIAVLEYRRTKYRVGSKVTMKTEWGGFKQDLERFEHFKSTRWVPEVGHNMYKCVEHNTFFDLSEEPCWQCWDETEEEI